MTQATIHCPERIAPATLAAWRDGTLSTVAAAHVAAHVRECPACRAEVATYEALDAALLRHRAPEPDERLWRAVRASIHGGAHRRQFRPTDASARRFGGLAALAAVVLLALGFAQVLHSRATATIRTSATATVQRGTPTPLPTAVPASPATDGPRLSWQQARLPIEPLTDQGILTFGVVPGHGESAYACHAISDRAGATLTLYHTTDRALHWTTLTQFTEPAVDLSTCMLKVDALDANRVLMLAHGQNMQTLKDAVWYELSEDGGATWTRLDDSALIYGLTTLNGKTYALRERMLLQWQGTEGLMVSVDHLRTWQPIDQSLVGPGQRVSNFWLSANGELLAEVTTTTSASGTPIPITTQGISALDHSPKRISVTLWRSSDGGKHWGAFPAPTLSGTNRSPHFVVGQPAAAGQPWHICAPYEVPGGATLACTFDGGRTWSARPLLCTVGPCAPAAWTGGVNVVASDGAVLTMAPRGNSQIGLYRLPQGSTTWQYLGPTAGSNAFFYSPAPNGGILWVFAGGTYSDGNLSGLIGGQQMLPGVLATATYP